jgi:hypothetical protein
MQSVRRFKFNLLSDNPSPERQAVVTRVLSNSEEALGPEVDFLVFEQGVTETYISMGVRLPSLC